jgi:hypothetical protein
MPNRPWLPGDDQHRSHQHRYWGLSCGQYDLMLETAAYACEIDTCRRSDQKLHTDHDHVTGWVRGLLCSGDNKALACVDAKRNGARPTRGITPRDPTEPEQRYLARAEERHLTGWPPETASW